MPAGRWPIAGGWTTATWISAWTGPPRPRAISTRALTNLLAGKPVEPKTTRAIGCILSDLLK